MNTKIAFVIYDGMTALDFVGVYDPLTRLKTMGFLPGLEWDVCARTAEVQDVSGLRFTPTAQPASLSGYDLLVLPGGYASRDLAGDPDFIAWLQTASVNSLKASACTGALLLGAAGFLQGKRATTHPGALEDLRPLCAGVSRERVVDEGNVVTAGGVTAAIDLGLHLVERLAGAESRRKIQQQMDYAVSPSPASPTLPPRQATVSRRTNETEIEVQLSLDGSGLHEIDTGIGFLDHMLTHLAVHGLFDLTLHAKGDLHIDVHHTLEDVALSLGQAFAEALGDRKGIVRMASAYTPMDEALAFVAVDLSGRPYTVFTGDWLTPSVANIPTSLFTHFLESFATAARLNLHARLLAGRDDHHHAEALFKALARALDAATQVDSRRVGSIPSTKGTLTV